MSTHGVNEPTRSELDQSKGPILLEFGATWCGHCRSTAPLISAQLAKNPGVRHIKIEDGPGQPLGRSYGVKLWPTLVFLKGGRVEAIAVRPGSTEIREGLIKINGPDSTHKI